MNFRGKVNSIWSGQRLDLYLKSQLPISREAIKKILKSSGCLINGECHYQSDKKLNGDDIVEFEYGEQKNELKEEKNETPILWEDEYLIVCNKNAGLTVHPCPSQPENTLLQQLLSAYPEIRKIGGTRPGIVHRLDKDTSGLLIVALTEETRLKLIKAFSSHLVIKNYLCLVKGHPEEQGKIDLPIGRHPRIKTRMAIARGKNDGKEALTEWRLLRYYPVGDFSLLNVRIYTGRTHQIRVHMASIGYPLLGDKIYAPGNVSRMAPRQMLHAWKLDFAHPVTSEALHFTSLPPEDFKETILKNNQFIPLVVVTGKPGSGKSTVCKMLAEKNIPYVSADQLVEELYSRPSPVTEWVGKYFGPDTVDIDGSIKKDTLFYRMEADSEMKKDFENYVHQIVLEKIQEFWLNNQNANYSFVLAEIPLYFELNWQKKFTPNPLTVYVSSSVHTRRSRLEENRGWNEEKIAAIDSWQWPDEKKKNLCDFIVVNEDDTRELLVEVERIYNKIIEGIDNRNIKESAIFGQIMTDDCGKI